MKIVLDTYLIPPEKKDEIVMQLTKAIRKNATIRSRESENLVIDEIEVVATSRTALKKALAILCPYDEK